MAIGGRGHIVLPPSWWYRLLHFAWGTAEAKCILATAVCASVCPSPHSHTTARTWM